MMHPTSEVPFPGIEGNLTIGEYRNSNAERIR